MNTPRARAHWIALIALLLCACGGGGDDEEGRAEAKPPDCKLEPRQCM